MSERITGIVLAAGPSRRFVADRPKLLAPFGNEPLIRRTTRAVLASRLDQVCVVVGHHSPTFAAVLAGMAIELVENLDYQKGQSTSVRAALRVLAPDCRAAIFIPGDQPFVSAELVNRLADTFEKTPAPIIVPSHAGQRGAPVLIARALFAELDDLQGDAGARQIFAKHESRILELPLDDPLPLRDIDTFKEYERLKELIGKPELRG